MTDIGTFHNGVSAASYACKLVIENDSLLIYLEGEGQNLLIWNIKSCKTCQFFGQNLIITYGSYPHQSIECSGAIAKRIYEKFTSSSVVAKVEGFVFSKGLLALSILTVSILAISVWSYFYLLPYVGEKSAGLIPMATEVEMGNSIADKILATSEKNDSVNFYTTQFVSKLKFNTPYKIKATVINSKDINAFALPGGNIFVYSEIIKKMNSYEELVALLGHEQTHVNNQHSLKSVCRSIAASILIATLFGDITGISAGILYQAQQFEQLNYSRDLETEADDEGLKFMIANQINPQGMVNLLELLNKESVEMPSVMKYLSTHPETDSRILNVKSQLTNLTNFNSNTDLELLFKKIKAKL